MPSDNDLKGMRQIYQETGHLGYAGGPGDKTIDKGASGSHRDNNWKKGAAQGKLKNAKPIGPGKNLNELPGGNFY